jgi:hypothetical protein
MPCKVAWRRNVLMGEKLPVAPEWNELAADIARQLTFDTLRSPTMSKVIERGGPLRHR